MTTKLRAAIIGCGGMSRNHIRGYIDCGRYEVVALADLNEAPMNEVDAQFNISTKHYTDARKMMEQERPDVVSICTWHAGHVTWTVAAAAYQPKAILCEKPMADSIGGAEQMMVACRRNKVKLAIAHQRRFLPAYTLAKDLIAQGALGKIHLIQSFGGAGLPNYSSHQTDMYRYLLSDDECEWVMGNIERKKYIRTRSPQLQWSDETLDYFIQQVGSDLYRLRSEVQKLSLRANRKNHTQIHKEHIDEVVFTMIEGDVFAVFDALFKDIKKSMQSLDIVHDRGAERNFALG